jgi:hypothetical protein
MCAKIIRSPELACERTLYLQQKMHWRVRRYGRACLTLREREAMEYEMNLLSAQHHRVPILSAIAAKMRISHQRVSVLLQHASLVMEYFDHVGVEVVWQRRRRGWVLIAPTQPVSTAHPLQNNEYPVH